jgi:hypothetical protein
MVNAMSRRVAVMSLAFGVALAVTLTADQRGRQAAANPQAEAAREGTLKPGDLAPDFTLEPRGGGAPIRLSSFRGRQHVALVFGSYT